MTDKSSDSRRYELIALIQRKMRRQEFASPYLEGAEGMSFTAEMQEQASISQLEQWAGVATDEFAQSEDLIDSMLNGEALMESPTASAPRSDHKVGDQEVAVSSDSRERLRALGGSLKKAVGAAGAQAEGDGEGSARTMKLAAPQALRDYGITTIEQLSAADQQHFKIMVDEFSTTGQSAFLERLYAADFAVQPASPKDFFTDEYFLGSRGRSIYPVLLEELDYVLDPGHNILEWVLTGSIGYGKSTAAVFAQAYRLHYMLCLKDVHAFYELMPGSLVVIMFFGLTMDRTDMTLWQKLEGFLTHSPYFKEQGFVGDPQRREPMLQFPKDIQVVTGSKAAHSLSLDICGGILDEQEFRQDRYGKAYGAGAKPYDLYRQVRSRMNSRFPSKTPGLLCTLSSVGTQSGFMAQHIEKVSGDPRTHVSSFSRYEVSPGRFTGATFQVEVGDEFHPSRILAKGEKKRTRARIELVPVAFLEDFRRNVDEGLQDISGIATFGTSKLFGDRASILENVDLTRNHPFTKDSVPLGIGCSSTLVEYFHAAQIAKRVNGGWKPRVRPQEPRYIHVDLAETRDACGLAMGHFGGFKKQRSTIPTSWVLPWSSILWSTST